MIIKTIEKYWDWKNFEDESSCSHLNDEQVTTSWSAIWGEWKNNAQKGFSIIGQNRKCSSSHQLDHIYQVLNQSPLPIHTKPPLCQSTPNQAQPKPGWQPPVVLWPTAAGRVTPPKDS